MHRYTFHVRVKGRTFTHSYLRESFGEAHRDLCELMNEEYPRGNWRPADVRVDDGRVEPLDRFFCGCGEYAEEDVGGADEPLCIGCCATREDVSSALLGSAPLTPAQLDAMACELATGVK